MALTTSLAGRVRNTKLPKSQSLLPLFEAIVNAIQAVDVRFPQDPGKGTIRVTVDRLPQGALDLGNLSSGRPPLNPIVGFRVVDNGVGFDAGNMKSFETLDSDHKRAVGSRGVGRLLWLVAFDRVTIRSAFGGVRDQLSQVQFRFSVDHEVEPESPDGLVEFVEPGTSVHLEGFKPEFQRNTPKGVDAVARAIFEHTVWYFLRPGGGPEVVVTDGDETVSLRAVLDEFVRSELPTTSVDVKGVKFDMANLCLKTTGRSQQPRLHWCAANRVVVDESLSGRVAGLHGRLKDASGDDFTYVCYLSSDFLDDHVRADRTAFDLDESSEATLGDEITMSDIRDAVLGEVRNLLAKSLAQVEEAGRRRVEDFVSRTAPRYRPVLKHLEELGVSVDPDMKDADLEELLHRALQRLEGRTMSETRALLANADALEPVEQQEKLAEHMATITDLNQADLAAYVWRRRLVLEDLKSAIGRTPTGNYHLEKVVHSLLMPMRTDSNDLSTDAANLWILDERLAFHDYLASDKTLAGMPITGSNSKKEPDLLATRAIDVPFLAVDGRVTSAPMASITVVEMKRPMRSDASDGNNPIEQVLEYVQKVRDGGLYLVNGRRVSAQPNAPAYCYVIADLTPKMETRCGLAGLTRLHDGQGYFGYNANYQAYIEVLTYDGLLNGATERNRAFFDKLNLPVT